MDGSNRYAELVIRLISSAAHAPRPDGPRTNRPPREPKQCDIELRFSEPSSDAYTEPDPGQATFDLDQLETLRDDVDRYGALLGKQLFADPTILSGFRDAVAKAAEGQVPLRLRLDIDIDDQELNGLRWETLHDPATDTPLARSERILFSRYLRSGDNRTIPPRLKSALRAVVLVANPTDLNRYGRQDKQLEALDPELELDIAQAGLGEIPCTPLIHQGEATLQNLIQSVRDGCDIVYIVCHGAVNSGRTTLYLEDDGGTTDAVDGAALADALARIRQLPRLVVLAACQSADAGAMGVLPAVGPLLGRAGVPAVIAMQAKISVDTSRAFMARFFKELAVDGQIDRAMAVARDQIADELDAWMPVLFTRLQSGCLWLPYTTPTRPYQLDALWQRIQSRDCVPILGPGLIEFLLGTTQDIAQRWAETYRFPLSIDLRQSLPQVAQYLGVVTSDPQFPRRYFPDSLKQQIRHRWANELPATRGDVSVSEMVSLIGREQRRRAPSQVHKVLAECRLPIYVTTTPDNLMADALREAGADPVVDVFDWTDRTEDDEDPWPQFSHVQRDDYTPSPERPLIYHLFGHLDAPDSLVLTEDDYFDYLIAITKQASLKGSGIPQAVPSAWNRKTLLFLGFRLDAWVFRVLFRSIMRDPGRALRAAKPNMAVQIDPGDDSSMDPERARTYLEKYFGDERINIYWRSTDEFAAELWKLMQPSVEHPSSDAANPQLVAAGTST